MDGNWNKKRYIPLILAGIALLIIQQAYAFVKRVLKFCVGYPLVLLFGTFSHLDPEGRSQRLGLIEAAKYAWGITG